MIDEGAVVGEAADGAADSVAFLDFGEAAIFVEAFFFFEHDAAVDDAVFIGGIELGDAAANLLADELFHLGGVAGAGARGGEEGADADVDGETALDDAGDGAGDGGLLGEGALERGPVRGLGDAGARECRSSPRDCGL